jgi:hypothetical protein
MVPGVPEEIGTRERTPPTARGADYTIRVSRTDGRSTPAAKGNGDVRCTRLREVMLMEGDGRGNRLADTAAAAQDLWDLREEKMDVDLITGYMPSY